MPPKNLLHIPSGIRLISWATAIRFFGWGFVEMLIPVFLIAFVRTYAEVGVLRSVYDIVFLLALPVVSHFADKISSKKIILSGLVLYPFIAICYFFAGLYGAVGLIVVARAVNGLSYALDSVGKKTYMRRYAKHEKIGLIFGYFDTLANFWWLAAAAVGLFLLPWVTLYQLFLLIIPTTLIAMYFVGKIPHERSEAQDLKNSQTIFRHFLREIWRDYQNMWLFIKNWSFEQKYVSALYAFLNIMYVVIAFFIPLVSYEANQSYTLVFLITAFATLPFLFGVPLGALADKATMNTLKVTLFVGLGLLAALPFVATLWITLLMIFFIGTGIYYISLILERLATDHEKRSHMGSLSGAFLSLVQIPQIVAPICIGFFIDTISLPVTIVLITLCGVLIALPLFSRRVRIFDLAK